MFQSLSEKLESAFKNIKGQARITDLNIANTVKDIRRWSVGFVHVQLFPGIAWFA